MTRQIFLCSAGALGCILAAGCADYPESRQQRQVYSHQNVDMGSADSGREYRSDGTRYDGADRR
jgi:hypothetical protein